MRERLAPDMKERCSVLQRTGWDHSRGREYVCSLGCSLDPSLMTELEQPPGALTHLTFSSVPPSAVLLYMRDSAQQFSCSITLRDQKFWDCGTPNYEKWKLRYKHPGAFTHLSFSVSGGAPGITGITCSQKHFPGSLCSVLHLGSPLPLQFSWETT